MPLPKPRPTESKQEFIRRCMGDAQATSEFPDRDQRYAVCQTQWAEK